MARSNSLNPHRAKYEALAQYAEDLLKLRADPRPWIEENLSIRSKDRRIIPFKLNWAQTEFYAHRTRRDIILKPRQLGFTTLVCGLYFADTLLRPNTTSVMVAHDIDSSEKIFAIVRLFWERLPDAQRRLAGTPRFSNRRELFWPSLNSHFFVGTAGSLTFGRGHTIHNLHCSEFAYWTKPQEALIALSEAVPHDGRIIIESTANGVGNYLHDLWSEAKAEQNEYRWHFYVWWENPEYRLPGEELTELTEEERSLQAKYKWEDDQIRWRRWKLQQLRDRFRQEYPEDDVTCFLTSGRCCFDVQELLAMQQRIAAEPAPQLLGALRTPRGNLLPIGPARLLVWKQPVQGQLYVIGADVGEGVAGGDPSCAIVLERESGEQVAELHGIVPPERFAHQLDALGHLYNRAVIAVERNNHGHSTLNTLRNVCRYPLLYWHVRYDHTVGKELTLGWPTDQATKPILVDDLAAAIAQRAPILHSSALVDELLTFVTTDTGAQEAQQGKHDDRVISLGVAWQVRKRGVSRGLTIRPPGM